MAETKVSAFRSHLLETLITSLAEKAQVNFEWVHDFGPKTKVVARNKFNHKFSV